MKYLPMLLLGGCASLSAQADDLGYEGFLHSTKRIKCMYGYVTAKTGNFDAARTIFEDCVARWNDVYSMIWLAQMYENGNGVPKDLTQAAAMLRRGAEQPDDASYVSLARYHWGVALAEGRGVAADPVAARTWLERAAADGESSAREYLQQLDAQAMAADTPPPAEQE